jgi:hypothetical protein
MASTRFHPWVESVLLIFLVLCCVLCFVCRSQYSPHANSIKYKELNTDRNLHNLRFISMYHLFSYSQFWIRNTGKKCFRGRRGHDRIVVGFMQSVSITTKVVNSNFVHGEHPVSPLGRICIAHLFSSVLCSLFCLSSSRVWNYQILCQLNYKFKWFVTWYNGTNDVCVVLCI